MNTLMRRAMIAAGVGAVIAIPLAGHASDGTITFSGAVTGNTCTVVVNNTTASATVTLPTVDSSALGGTGTTAAGTFFSMTVSGCTSPAVNDFGAGAPTTVQIYFEAGADVDEATGALINTATGGSNVEVKLFNASGNDVVGTQVMPGTNTNQPGTQPIGTGGTQWFYAGYSATGAAAGAAGTVTPGVVTTAVTYSLIYN